MTAKDLHFSFDDALAQSRAAAAAETGISGMQAQERSAPVTPLRGGGRRTRGGDRHPAWIVTGLIALLNMAFLFIAALWLTGNTYRVADAAQPVPAAAGNSEGTALADLQASVAATNTRLEELSTIVAAQTELLAAMQDQLAQSQVAPAAPASPAPAASEEIVHPPWRINLGSFPSAAGARRLQDQLASLGYKVRIAPPDGPAQPSYRAWLGGYADRESADAAVHQIMQQTSLTGLWVSNQP